MRTLALAVLLIAPLAACGSDDSDASRTEEATESVQSDLPEDLPDIVCDTVEDATEALDEAGYSLRVVRIDGEDLAVTADFVENRVNVAVETDGDTEIVTGVISTG